MTLEDTARRLEAVLAHLWMVRTYLKHAEEVQDDEGLMDVPRTLFDVCRAVEPAFQRGDWKEYVHRLRGKLPKIRRVSAYYSENFRRVSDHTNHHQAALSLRTALERLEEILAQPEPSTGGDGGGGKEGPG